LTVSTAQDTNDVRYEMMELEKVTVAMHFNSQGRMTYGSGL